MDSPTGKRITLFTDNGLFNDNPWKEIRSNKGTWRYRIGEKTPWEIEKLDGPGWLPVDQDDYDYWTDYINKLEKSAKNVPTDNFFQYTGKWITGKLDKKKCGGHLVRINGKLVNIPK
jgi:hypothetical protein